MLCQVFLKPDVLARIIKIRILSSFQTFDMPVDLDRVEGNESEEFEPEKIRCYLDGLSISSFDFGPSTRTSTFSLNNNTLVHRQVQPVNSSFTFNPVRARLNGHLLFVSERALRAAAVADQNDRYPLPPRIMRPLSNLELDLLFTVSTAGVPLLRVELGQMPFGLPDNLLAEQLVKSLVGMSFEMPMDRAFSDALDPGFTRTLNAGLCFTESDLIMRFEFEPEAEGAANNGRRLLAWQQFFAGEVGSPRGAADWAIDIPTKNVVASAARDFDEGMSTAEVQKHFSSGNKAWGAWTHGQPAFTLHKRGVFESACAGLDPQGELIAHIKLSVPVPGTLRTEVELEIDIDNFDAWKCIGMSLLNPLGGLITVFDNSEDLPWWLEILGIFITISPAIAMVGWGLGLDDVATRLAIEEAQKEAVKKGKPPVIRTSMSTFYTDSVKSITTPITRDWLTLTGVSARGDRLLLAGSFSGPDLNTLPRLFGLLSDKFDAWGEKDKCSTNIEWRTTAAVDLRLDENGQTVWNPLIPIRYGIDLELVDGEVKPVGQATWRIIDDTFGVYGGPSGYTSWTGVPGTFEVRVTNPPEPFASSPNPLILRFFTSCGVREFIVPPPPPVPKLTPTEWRNHQLERAANCYIFSTMLTRIKALQVLWLPTPRPDQRVAQHWQIVLANIDPGRLIKVWDIPRNMLLAEVEALADQTEISLVTTPDQSTELLQLTLDGEDPLPGNVYASRVRGLVSQNGSGATPLRMQQTPLHLIGRLALSEQLLDFNVEQVSANAIRVQLHHDAGNVKAFILDLHDGRTFVGLTTDLNGGRLDEPAERSPVTVRSSGGRGHRLAPGQYYARPWHDRGAVAGPYFVRLSDTDDELEIYMRGLTHTAFPDTGGEHQFQTGVEVNT